MSVQLNVLVLLSTYNGEQYLKEQIDSILAQEGVNVYLLARDDGSNDSTCSILEEYAEQNCNVDWFSGENVGFVKSFSALVKMALEYRIKLDFYAFADQDDIWMSDKLITACLTLREKNADLPNLFTSNSIIYDGKEKKGLYHPIYPNYTLGNILIYGTEQGCSMVFNKKALLMYANKIPYLSYHDRYMYLICKYLGSVTYCHRPLFYYRLHSNNAIGIPQRQSHSGSKLLRMISFIKILGDNSSISMHHSMACEFFSNYGDCLSLDRYKILNRYVKYKKSLLYRFLLLYREYRYPYPLLGLKMRVKYFLYTITGKL